MPLILGTNSIKDVGYEVDNSLRFDDGSSDGLQITGQNGNRKTFTFSCWVKRGVFGENFLFNSRIDASNHFLIRFTGSHQLELLNRTSASNNFILTTNRLFRDVSAWYHIVVAVDTTQSTANDRVKFYVNGVQETSFATQTMGSQNADLSLNISTATHYIGQEHTSGSNFFDGYMAEVVFIDGTAQSNTDLGEFDEDSSVWKPIDVSGLTFGTNGFYLDFENSGSLGADVSGNGNNFTVNNLTSIDQTTDTCTNNFCTWNPLVFHNSKITFSEGNLVGHEGTNDLYYGITPTIFPTAGKWYAEAKFTTLGISQIGLITAGSFIDANRNLYSSSSNIYMQTGQTSIEGFLDGTGFTVTVSGGSNSSLTAPVVNDIIMFAWDLDNGRAWYGLNGTWQNSGNPETPTNWFNLQTDYADGVNLYAGLCGCGTGDTTATVQVNWGNPPYTISSGNSDGNGYGNFEYSVPSGYYALNTKNLAEYG